DDGGFVGHELLCAAAEESKDEPSHGSETSHSTDAIPTGAVFDRTGEAARIAVMKKHYVLKCSSCGAPAADCVPICPYCGKATGFAELGTARGIERMKGGGFKISGGAHVDIGASDEPRECPFCGAMAEAKARFCGHCNAKIVVERMRIARLVIQGGSMTIGGGGKLEIVGRRKRTLHHAASIGDLDAVKKEVEDGDDPDFQDGDGRRPMHYAAAGGHVEVAKWLVSVGADPDPKDDGGKRPIQAAKDDGMRAFLKMMGAR
ncbi:MAG: ankyrin repeat domain-containing protein, partial [Myxococcota bacterium]